MFSIIGHRLELGSYSKEYIILPRSIMTLNIKDAEAERLARELARRTGTTMTGAGRYGAA